MSSDEKEGAGHQREVDQLDGAAQETMGSNRYDVRRDYSVRRSHGREAESPCRLDSGAARSYWLLGGAPAAGLASWRFVQCFAKSAFRLMRSVTSSSASGMLHSELSSERTSYSFLRRSHLIFERHLPLWLRGAVQSSSDATSSNARMSP